jgi:hypothetical protein
MLCTLRISKGLPSLGLFCAFEASCACGKLELELHPPVAADDDDGDKVGF